MGDVEWEVVKKPDPLSPYIMMIILIGAAIFGILA